jgi:hypothetical protein
MTLEKEWFTVPELVRALPDLSKAYCEGLTAEFRQFPRRQARMRKGPISQRGPEFHISLFVRAEREALQAFYSHGHRGETHAAR